MKLVLARIACCSALALVFVGGAIGYSPSNSSARLAPSCVGTPEGPSLELVYRLAAGKERVTAHTREEAAAIVCRRLQTIGIARGAVRLQGKGRIRVVLPQRHRRGDRRLAERLSIPGRLGLFAWEADLIGPERAIGGHPGSAPRESGLARARHEWRVAGRRERSSPEAALVLSGAFPNAYGAVSLASRQKPRLPCSKCSASTPRFYMFDRSPAHRLIGGPVAERGNLPQAGRRGHLIVKVPVGTMIVFEHPISSTGKVLTGVAPGWFALRDKPSLTNSDIVRPMEGVDELGEPTVTFGFSRKGRLAFRRLTRSTARCGRLESGGGITVGEAETLSCHIATVFDGEVKARPIINFVEFPRGIDGRTGAQISGEFATRRQARNLVAMLRIAPLPIDLTLVRLVGAQNS